MVNFDDFSKLELKIGKILEVNPHPDAEKLYLLKVDIGEKVIQLNRTRSGDDICNGFQSPHGVFHAILFIRLWAFV